MNKIYIMAVLMSAISLFGQNTTVKVVVGAISEKLPEIERDTIIEPNNNPLNFNKKAISIKSFEKAANDSQESFIMTNNTDMSISRVELQLQYVDMSGNIIHKRNEIIECEIPAKEVRRVAVKSFDSQHVYYYYLSNVPRKKATPFKAAFKLLRYDVIIKAD